MIFISRLPSSMVALHKSESNCMGFLSKIKLPMGSTLHYVRDTLFQLVKQHLISINIFQFFFFVFFFTLIFSFIYYHFLNDFFLDFLKAFFFRSVIRSVIRSDPDFVDAGIVVLRPASFFSLFISLLLFALRFMWLP